MSFLDKIFGRNKQTLVDKKWLNFQNSIFAEDFRLNSLPEDLKKVALCVIYDNQMTREGHRGFLKKYPEINNNELIEALEFIGNKEFADNFFDALRNGTKDDYVRTDEKYLAFEPDLFNYIQEYFENNIDKFS